MWQRASLWFLVLTSSAVVSAQPSTDLAWFESQWAEAASWKIPDNTYIEYTIEIFFDTTEDDVQQLWTQIEGHPQHPLWQEYERKREQLEWGGVLRTDIRAWWTDKGWRLTRDSPQDTANSFRDTVVTKNIAWRRTPESMVLAEPSGSHERYDHWREGVALRRTVVEFVLGGLGYESTTPIQYKPLTAAREFDGSWVARIANDDATRVKELHGYVDGTDLLVDRIELIESGTMLTVVDKQRRFLEWQYDEYFGRSVAHIVETYDENGILRSRKTLHAAHTIDPRVPFESVAKLPDESHPDPIRDAASPLIVTDARPGRETITITRGDTIEVQSLPGSVPEDSKRTLRYIGWIVIVGAVCAVAWWRLRGTR